MYWLFGWSIAPISSRHSSYVTISTMYMCVGVVCIPLLHGTYIHVHVHVHVHVVSLFIRCTMTHEMYNVRFGPSQLSCVGIATV